MKNQEEGEEEIKDIVGRKYLENLCSLYTGGEDDNCWIVRQSCVDPGQGKHNEAGVAKFLIFGVATKLC